MCCMLAHMATVVASLQGRDIMWPLTAMTAQMIGCKDLDWDNAVKALYHPSPLQPQVCLCNIITALHVCHS